MDNEQKMAVIGDEDRALVVAGAGTGKTTTIAAKVKYLVDIKKVPPEKILVMSYTRKAVEELQRRIVVDLGIQATVKTFHSLGLNYLRYLNEGTKVSPISINTRNEIFLNFLKECVFQYKDKLNEMISLFNDQEISWVDPRMHTYGPFFLENYQNYSSFDDYFEAYIQKKIRETSDIVKRVNDIADWKVNGEYPTTIRGERVKSKGEAVIANFLLCNGVDYYYEREYDEYVGDHQVYHPDFSIDVGGERIYIEYFGMSGSDIDNRSYQRIRRMKEQYHHDKHNKFIALDYMPERRYLGVLAEELKKLGVDLKPKSIEEIYYLILKQNPLAEFYYLGEFFYQIIDTIKTSEDVRSFEEYKNLCRPFIENEGSIDVKNKKQKQFNWIEEFWNYYHESKASDSAIMKVDYAEMIEMPRGHISEIIPSKMNFDYVIVDEYQDISAARFKLLEETLKCSGSKFFAIGDDWQSIFSFQGAKVGYILNFDKYFPGAKKYIISNTYRNAQSLINAAGKFVMRNHTQIKKDLKSKKDISRPICFVKIKPQLFKDRHSISYRNEAIESMIKEIHHYHPKDSICVIGRTNSMISSLYQQSNFINSAENKVRIKGIDGFYFDALTVHKSKGLTYDWTIIMPLTKHFPADPKKVFWLLDIVRNYPEEEAIPFAEQRRLFYVALTRTKNRVYILLPRKGEHSKYKDELYQIIKELSELQELSID